MIVPESHNEIRTEARAKRRQQIEIFHLPWGDQEELNAMNEAIFSLKISEIKWVCDRDNKIDNVFITYEE